jgi:hypothetical protein
MTFLMDQKRHQEVALFQKRPNWILRSLGEMLLYLSVITQ